MNTRVASTQATHDEPRLSTSASTSITRLAEQHVVLMWQECQLLLPQSDVFSLETPLDLTFVEKPSLTVTTHVDDPNRAGAVAHLNRRQQHRQQQHRQQQRLPVFCLSPEFILLTSAPASHRLCAVLQINGNPILGLICEDVRFQTVGSIVHYDIPTCMKAHEMAYESLALASHEGTSAENPLDPSETQATLSLVYQSSTKCLMEHIRRQTVDINTR